MLVKPHVAHEMLEWKSFAALLQGFAQRDQIAFLHQPVELEIEIHPGAAQLVGDEHLHVAAGVLDAAFFEIAGAAIDSFQDRAHS